MASAAPEITNLTKQVHDERQHADSASAVSLVRLKLPLENATDTTGCSDQRVATLDHSLSETPGHTSRTVLASLGNAPHGAADCCIVDMCFCRAHKR